MGLYPRPRRYVVWLSAFRCRAKLGHGGLVPGIRPLWVLVLLFIISIPGSSSSSSIYPSWFLSYPLCPGLVVVWLPGSPLQACIPCSSGPGSSGQALAHQALAHHALPHHALPHQALAHPGPPWCLVSAPIITILQHTGTNPTSANRESKHTQCCLKTKNDKPAPCRSLLILPAQAPAAL